MADGMIAPHTIVRRMSIEDLRECADRGLGVYEKYYPHVDREGMFRAALANHGDPSALMVRTKDAFGIATAGRTLQEPRLWVQEQFAFSLGGVWQVIAIYRAMKRWAEDIGAFRFSFGSSTEYDLDAVAKRIGTHRIAKTYDFDLE